jgi:hypothetical protein
MYDNMYLIPISTYNILNPAHDFREGTVYLQVTQTKKNKQTPWPLVRERTIPTDTDLRIKTEGRNQFHR